MPHSSRSSILPPPCAVSSVCIALLLASSAASADLLPPYPTSVPGTAYQPPRTLAGCDPLPHGLGGATPPGSATQYAFSVPRAA
eukprot:3730182-Rhodomonas_salina.1